MKKKTVFVASFIALAVAGGLTFGSINSQASSTAEQDARLTFDKYIAAVMDGNAEDMIKYTDDQRFLDESSKEIAYESLANDKDVQELEVLNFKKIDGTHMIASVRFKSKYSGVHQIEMPVVKAGDEWKVVIEKQ
ncbi:DUF4878 domain-containing protein [Tumebacillus algifaecis]|uniref:DUF4878 domain-containing protein n=1 Tax=Tumebacillus algifaecis TaxID=1214604 RepID=UPI0012FD13E5|nr:DUF4878 domain-containing protein [Tumebacillus algifaecis]